MFACNGCKSCYQSLTELKQHSISCDDDGTSIKSFSTMTTTTSVKSQKVMKKLIKENDQFKDRLKKTEKKVEVYLKKYKDAKESRDEYNEKMVSLLEEKAILIQKINTFEQENKQLEYKILQTKEEERRLHLQESSDLHDQSQRLAIMIKETQDKYDFLQRDFKDMVDREVAVFKSTHHCESSPQFKRLKEIATSKSEEANELKQSLTENQKVLKDKVLHITNLETQLRHVTQMIVDVKNGHQSHCVKLQKERDDLLVKAKTKQQQLCSQLRSEMTSLVKEHAEQLKDIKALHDVEISNMQKVITVMKEEVEHAKTEYRRGLVQSSTSQRLVLEATNQLEKQELEQRLKVNNTVLERELEVRFRDKYESSISKLTDLINARNEKIVDLETDLKRKSYEMEESESRHAKELSDKVEELNIQTELLKVKSDHISELLVKVENRSNRIDFLSENIRESKLREEQAVIQLEREKGTVKVLQDKSIKLLQDLHTAEKHLQSLQTSHDDYMEKNNVLSKSFSELKENYTRNYQRLVRYEGLVKRSSDLRLEERNDYEQRIATLDSKLKALQLELCSSSDVAIFHRRRFEKSVKLGKSMSTKQETREQELLDTIRDVKSELEKEKLLHVAKLGDLKQQFVEKINGYKIEVNSTKDRIKEVEGLNVSLKKTVQDERLKLKVVENTMTEKGEQSAKLQGVLSRKVSELESKVDAMTHSHEMRVRELTSKVDSEKTIHLKTVKDLTSSLKESENLLLSKTETVKSLQQELSQSHRDIKSKLLDISKLEELVSKSDTHVKCLQSDVVVFKTKLETETQSLLHQLEKARKSHETELNLLEKKYTTALTETEYTTNTNILKVRKCHEEELASVKAKHTDDVKGKLDMISRLKRELNTKVLELKGLEISHRKLANEKNNLSLELDTSHASLAKYKQAVDSLSKDKNTLLLNLEECKTSLTSVKVELEQLYHTNKSLKVTQSNALSDLRATFERNALNNKFKYDANTKILNQTILTLEADFKVSTQKLKEYSDREATMKDTILSLKHRVESLENELSKGSSMLEDIQKYKSSTFQNMQKLERKIHQFKIDSKNDSQKIRELSRENAILLEKLEDVTLQHELSCEKLQTSTNSKLNSLREKSDTTLASLRDDLSRKQGEIDVLKSTNDTLSSTVKSQIEQLHSKETLLHQSLERINELNAKHESVTRKTEEIYTLKLEKASECERLLRNDHDRLKENMNLLQKRFVDKSVEMDDKLGLKGEMNLKLDKLREENISLRSRLENEVTSKSQTILILRHQYQAVKDKSIELEKEKEILESQIKLNPNVEKLKMKLKDVQTKYSVELKEARVNSKKSSEECVRYKTLYEQLKNIHSLKGELKDE